MPDEFTRREVNRALLVAAVALAARIPSERIRRVAALFDFAIAGGWYDGLRGHLSSIALGQALELRAEPHNPYDGFAVAVHFHGVRLGYIPRVANRPVFELLARGVCVKAVVTSFLDIHRASEIPDDLVFTGFASGDPRVRLTIEQV